MRRNIALFCCLALTLGFVAEAAEQNHAPQPEQTAESRAKQLADPSLPLRERCNLLLQMGHACRAEGKEQQARDWYQQLVDRGDAPHGFASHARLCIGQSFVDEKKWTEARAVLSSLADDQKAPAHHKGEALERIGEIARLEKGLPALDPKASRTTPPEWPTPGKILYVAPNGEPGNPGNEEAPLDSLTAARGAVRRLRSNSGLPTGGVLVLVQPGVYRVQQTIAFSKQDSGTLDAPIVYRAAEAGMTVFSGGAILEGFKPVEDEAILARLPEEARGKVQMVDLKSQGITEYGVMKPHGATLGNHPILELFFQGRAMRLARWPNKGYIRTGEVHDEGSESPPRGPVFGCAEERLERWGHAQDPWIFGFPRYLWSDASLPVASIDAESDRVTLGAPYYAYNGGMKPNMPLYFYNLLEEIDQPGEYYLDREAGVLYFFPPEGVGTAEISLLSEPFLRMKDVSHTALEGLTFELGQTHAIQIEGGSHCLVAGCTLRKLGGNALMLTGGKNHGVLGCDMHVLGMGGVRIDAGDRATLDPAGHYVENCHVFDFSRVNRTYTPAVHVDGVGMRVTHNEFHNSPCHAIRLNGNEHRVEFNEVYHVNLESDDQGGLDMWFDPSHRGNTIRYNYWHDIGGNEFPCGAAGVRLDDAISETVVYGNVFRRCSQGHFGGVQIHGGKENYIENNIFIDCAAAVSLTSWGEKRWADFLKSPRTVEALTKTVDISAPPYSTRYPALAHLAENPDINRIWRNIVFDCKALIMRDNGRQEVMDNLFTKKDPGFVDADAGNYELRADAPALRQVGFRPIPFSAIGTYRDGYRKH